MILRITTAATARVRRPVAAGSLPLINTRLSPLACPLAPGWPARLRQMQFVFSDPGEAARLNAAHLTELGARLASVAAEWRVAADDPSQATPAEESHLTPGFPCHLHTEFEVGGQRVHIDRTGANLWRPGRLRGTDGLFAGTHAGYLAGGGAAAGRAGACGAEAFIYT